MRLFRWIVTILTLMMICVTWTVYPAGKQVFAATKTEVNVEGHWASAEVGPIDLYQSGVTITGSWAMGTITGTISGNNCSFQYAEAGEKDKVKSVGAFVVQSDGLSLSGTWSYQNGKETESGSFRALKVLNQSSREIEAFDAQVEELPAVGLPMKLDIKEMIPNETVKSFYDTLHRILPDKEYSLSSYLRTESYVIPLTNTEAEGAQSILAFREIPSTLEAVPDNLWSRLSICGSNYYVLQEQKESLVGDAIKVLDEYLPVKAFSKVLNLHQKDLTTLQSSLEGMIFSAMEKKEEEIRNQLVNEISTSTGLTDSQQQDVRKNLSELQEYYRILSNLNKSMNDNYQRIIRNLRG